MAEASSGDPALRGGRSFTGAMRGVTTYEERSEQMIELLHRPASTEPGHPAVGRDGAAGANQDFEHVVGRFEAQAAGDPVGEQVGPPPTGQAFGPRPSATSTICCQVVSHSRSPPRNRSNCG